jgi:hypothetical protein
MGTLLVPCDVIMTTHQAIYFLILRHFSSGLLYFYCFMRIMPSPFYRCQPVFKQKHPHLSHPAFFQGFRRRVSALAKTDRTGYYFFPINV